jgi:hypothetical protein
LSGLGELEPARFALEQFQAEARLERAHLMADRPLRLVELIGRRCKAQGSSRRFEGPQRSERGWNPNLCHPSISFMPARIQIAGHDRNIKTTIARSPQRKGDLHVHNAGSQECATTAGLYTTGACRDA